MPARCARTATRTASRKPKVDHQAYFQTLAAYHRLANRRLLQALQPIDDADYYGDQGLFLKSIHRTLNHILLVDRLYHGRITGELFEVAGLDQELAHDRRQLAVDVERHGERWQDVIAGIDATRMQSVLRYLSTEGEQRELPMLV